MIRRKRWARTPEDMRITAATGIPAVAPRRPVLWWLKHFHARARMAWWEFEMDHARLAHPWRLRGYRPDPEAAAAFSDVMKGIGW